MKKLTIAITIGIIIGLMIGGILLGRGWRMAFDTGGTGWCKNPSGWMYCTDFQSYGLSLRGEGEICEIVRDPMSMADQDYTIQMCKDNFFASLLLIRDVGVSCQYFPDGLTHSCSANFGDWRLMLQGSFLPDKPIGDCGGWWGVCINLGGA